MLHKKYKTENPLPLNNRAQIKPGLIDPQN